MRNLVNLIVIGLMLGAFWYVYRAPIGDFGAILLARYIPCRVPITYTIGEFDPRFGVSKAEFLGDVAAAKSLWEKAAGKTLFTYAPDGHLKINLLYDNRQATTVQLSNLSNTVDTSKNSYDALKAQYDAQDSRYQSDKASYEADTASFQAELASYNQEVANWNSRGGAPADVYQHLADERSTLDATQSRLDTERANVNAEANALNALADTLNTMATSLNLNVAKYNQIGGQFAGEFDEGDYQSGPFGQAIDIYQFTSQDKLIRVLAHELGHALGLEHNSDPKAIMYYLNQGENETLTAADVAELDARCGIK